MKIAGLDIGTTGCKCTVFDENGKYLDRTYRDYPVKRSVGGHEIDVSAVMDGVYECVKEMAAKFSDIAGLGVTSFGETFVITDEDGMPLHTAMLYTDPRGEEQCKKLIDTIGEMKIAKISGLRPHEMYSISKLMWIKENEPEIYRNGRHAFLMEDYVVYHLTKVAQIDYSLATRTMAFDINTLEWSKEIFEVAGIDMGLMSKPVATGTLAGNVTAEAAAKTGLDISTKIVSVSHDQVAAAVGAGAFDGDVAVDGAGTVECLTPIYDRMPDIDVMYKGYFSVVPYVFPGKYVAYAFSYTGGALIQWCVDNLAKDEKVKANQLNISVNGEEKPSGILVLPHFSGAATPYMDIGSKGAIIGLTADTDVADIYRAAMEGVVYEMYLNYTRLNGSGIHFKRLNATGGGAKSKIWMQMKADVLGIPITALESVDAGTVGSAMLTGVAIGRFKNIMEAAEHMVRESVTYEPREEMHELYMEVFERYKLVYDAVRPLV